MRSGVRRCAVRRDGGRNSRSQQQESHMQPRTLVLKYFVVGLVAATCFVASPPFAQQKGASPSGVQTKKVRVNGVTLHYIERGQGTPVVLVHGTLGDYRTWDGQLEAFSKRYRVISYSRRYHYPNRWTKDSTDFSVTIHARDLTAFIKALKLPPVHLIGHSYGAFIAFLVARDHPEVIRSLTLGEPPVMPLLKTTPEGDALLTTFITTSIVPSGDAFKHGNDEEGVRRFVNGVLGEGSYEKLPPPVRKRLMDNAKELKGETSSQDLFPPITCEDVQKVKAPTLLLDGELSPKMFHLINDMLDHCLPSKERAMIPAASHGLEFENPQAFNETVLAFIAKH
jgi:non-heme chloroperoxidase